MNVDKPVEKPVEVPKGFERLPDGLGFGDSLQPLYRRISDDQKVSFGLIVQPQHLNLLGIMHGGALMALADISAATSIRVLRDQLSPSPTINLSFDFMAPGRPGRWLETRVDHLQVKRRFGFCSGSVYDGDTAILRYSGTFYFPDHEGLSVSPENAHKLKSFTGGDDDGVAR